jgi:leucyl aminopeptidase
VALQHVSLDKTLPCPAGEKYWRLPLNPDLKPKLESPIADLKNYAGVYQELIVYCLGFLLHMWMGVVY